MLRERQLLEGEADVAAQSHAAEAAIHEAHTQAKTAANQVRITAQPKHGLARLPVDLGRGIIRLPILLCLSWRRSCSPRCRERWLLSWLRSRNGSAQNSTGIIDILACPSDSQSGALPHYLQSASCRCCTNFLLVSRRREIYPDIPIGRSPHLMHPAFSDRVRPPSQRCRDQQGNIQRRTPGRRSNPNVCCREAAIACGGLLGTFLRSTECTERSPSSAATQPSGIASEQAHADRKAIERTAIPSGFRYHGGMGARSALREFPTRVPRPGLRAAQSSVICPRLGNQGAIAVQLPNNKLKVIYHGTWYSCRER